MTFPDRAHDVFPPATEGSSWEVTFQPMTTQGLFHQGEAHVTSSLQ